MTSTSGSVPTIYLHIGTPKSGTTYLQSRMETNRRRAASQGLLWPRPKWGVQVEAARDLRAFRPGDKLEPDGPWMRLVDQVMSWSGPRALISMEWLTGTTAEQAEAAIASLQPARVELVCTTRDLLRMFVAQWQEMTKNCRPWSWEQFVEEVVGEEGGDAAQRFWTQQDVPAVLRRWSRILPKDQIHLVTVPPSGADPEVLWNRFCSVLQIDGTAFDQPPRTNESIGVVSATLMHRINLVAIDKDLSKQTYQQVLHRGIADDVLAPFRSREGSISVSPEADAWLREKAAQQVDEIAAMDVDVVGDLAELLPGTPLTGRQPSEVTDGELLDTCVEALVTYALTQDERIKKLRADNKALRGRGGGTARPRAAKAGAGKGQAATQPSAQRLARRAKRLARRGKTQIARTVRRHDDEPTA